MPITGPASYLPTTDEFLAHWASANAALGAAGPIEVTGGVNAAALLALRTQLETARAQVEALRNGREQARFVIEDEKGKLLERLNQFNLKIRSLSPGSKWEAMLPKAFSVSEGMGRVIPPLDDMLDLWERYEAEESPLLLMGAYSLATFTAALAGLKASYTALSSAENGLGVKRSERTALENRIYPILKAYRQRIPAEFPEGSAILATLPPGAPLTYSTNFALGTPGNTASYKVYVITTAGNERGSNAVTVQRPA